MAITCSLAHPQPPRRGSENRAIQNRNQLPTSNPLVRRVDFSPELFKATSRHREPGVSQRHQSPRRNPAARYLRTSPPRTQRPSVGLRGFLEALPLHAHRLRRASAWQTRSPGRWGRGQNEGHTESGGLNLLETWLFFLN